MAATGANPVSLEGDLRVRLVLEPGRIRHVEIASSRPDVAQRLLQGRPRADVQAAVPLLFSVCGRSQATAAGLACAAAAGEAPSAIALAQAQRGVAAEMLREAAWLCLLQWPQRLGEAPSADAVAAARFSLAAPLTGADDVQRIALAAFGMPALQWLNLEARGDLQAWAEAGPSASARFIAQAMASPGQAAPANHPMLPTPLDDAGLAGLCRALDEDARFAQQPHWLGKPAETGALARQQHQPLLRALTEHDPSRIVARLVARLRELALLLLDAHTVSLGVMPAPDGGGIAWVENARGLLLHRVRLDNHAQQVLDYRIVAPTEWNFRPGGPLALALADAAVPDEATARRLATRLVHSLDPCVACHVEIAHA